MPGDPIPTETIPTAALGHRGHSGHSDHPTPRSPVLGSERELDGHVAGAAHATVDELRHRAAGPAQRIDDPRQRLVGMQQALDHQRAVPALAQRAHVVPTYRRVEQRARHPPQPGQLARHVGELQRAEARRDAEAVAPVAQPVAERPWPGTRRGPPLPRRTRRRP
ncbi:MAG: hypothetical protein O9345_13515 [Burkholderiaceae bacterium]|jgi:hypothetical protein|nr:hypothetical protein [Burkholderiaceae bacterium]